MWVPGAWKFWMPHRRQKSSLSSTSSSRSLDFFKPFEGHNTAEFTFAPERDASATNITWVMHGPSSFMSKVMQVFMNLDKMIGRDFETGLANLKRLTERQANA
jgi:hypothetical protein